MEHSMNQISIIDSTLFELIDIDQLEEVNHLSNMYDITVEGDESFVLADGIISHNSASGMGLSVRDPKYHGFYSLRGKVLNTHGMSDYDILKNKELSELIAIIGLDLGDSELYDDPNDLYEIEILGTKYIVGTDDEIIVDGNVYLAKDYI